MGSWKVTFSIDRVEQHSTSMEDELKDIVSMMMLVGICKYDNMKIIIKITSRVGAIDWWKTSRFCVKEGYIEGLYWFRHAYIICLELLVLTHISLLLFPLSCLLLPFNYVLRISHFWIVLFSWRQLKIFCFWWRNNDVCELLIVGRWKHI